MYPRIGEALKSKSVSQDRASVHDSVFGLALQRHGYCSLNNEKTMMTVAQSLPIDTVCLSGEEEIVIERWLMTIRRGLHGGKRI